MRARASILALVGEQVTRVSKGVGVVVEVVRALALFPGSWSFEV